jgi:hypothetical protein
MLVLAPLVFAGGDKQDCVYGVLELLLLGPFAGTVREMDSRIPQQASLNLKVVRFIQNCVADLVPFNFSLWSFDLSFS